MLYYLYKDQEAYYKAIIKIYQDKEKLYKDQIKELQTIIFNSDVC